MSEGVSESRFYMWRAVIALAHADNRVTEEEHEFIDRYLHNVPFSDSQREVLIDDVLNAKNVTEMFDQVSEPTDRGEFFEFARMIVWCDGDYDAQEEKLFAHLKDTQMHRVDKGSMEQLARDTRESERLKRAQEDEEFKAQAHRLVGLGTIISRVY